MIKFTIRRLVQVFFVLIILSFISFTLMGLMPGDPADIACAANPNCTTENLDQIKKTLGLDKPISTRYAIWLGNFISGDLGYSRTYRLPVTEIIGHRLLNTFILSIITILVSLIVAIPLGVFTGLKQNTKFDYVINFFAFSGISIPSFWLGFMLIMIFSVKLGWLPAEGTFTVGERLSGWDAVIDRAKYLLLPVFSLSAMTIAHWVRYTRSKMVETMRLDFITTARAKGIKELAVVWRHGFRNALIPIVTIVALGMSSIFSGAVITETVFSYQGVGKLIFDSIYANDYNVAMCSFVITALSVLLMNLIADLAYGFLDPRIRYE